MKKEILNRGYITYALTDRFDKIYGLNNNEFLSCDFFENELKKGNWFYKSEIYREKGYMAIIIRLGTRLANRSSSELLEIFEQSKINLN